MTSRWLASVLLAGSAAGAQPVDFDADVPGQPPAGWQCGSAGSGTAQWAVARDASAPSPPNVLRQSGRAAYPWCVRQDTALADGFVEVQLKPEGGREDQAGGLVWRWRSAESYYVARANALENNVSLYYTEGGVRRTIKYVDAPVAANRWHRLRVDFAGTRIKVALDGKMLIEVSDDHIVGAGSVGVWTKEDSVTAFDDFDFGATPHRR